MTTFSAILAILRFQFVWLLFVFGAANGYWWPGVAGAAVLIAIQIATSLNRGREVVYFGLTLLIAFAAEVIFSSTSAITYSAHWPVDGFAPVWIFGLWLAFSTAIPATRFLVGSNAAGKSILLGLIFGPLAYYGAAQYGAIAIDDPFWRSLAVIGAVWAVAFPLLVMVHAALFPAAANQEQPASV